VKKCVGDIGCLFERRRHSRAESTGEKIRENAPKKGRGYYSIRNRQSRKQKKKKPSVKGKGDSLGKPQMKSGKFEEREPLFGELFRG